MEELGRIEGVGRVEGGGGWRWRGGGWRRASLSADECLTVF